MSRTGMLGLALIGFWSIGGAGTAPASAAEAAFQVADLATAEENGSGVYLWERIELDGVLYFPATTPRHGLELWRSDGTAAGTRLVRDLCPGRCGSDPARFAVAGGRVFFFADDGVYGREPWSTDGTAAGTRLARDVCRGGCSSASGSRVELVGAGDSAYFWADDGEAGDELWRTDGTREGTTLVADVCPGGCSSYPRDLGVAGSRVYFKAKPAADADLSFWVSDGTPGGFEELVADCNCEPVASLGDKVFFRHWTAQLGDELWVSDGTLEGTALLADLCPGRCSGASVSGSYALFSGELFFTGHDDVNRRFVLYRSDGTAAGTRAVLGGGASFHEAIRSLTPLAGDLYFLADVARLRQDVFRTDGTPGSASRVRDAGVGEANVTDLVRAGDRLFFVLDSHELWASDGSAAGSSPVLDLPRSDFRPRTVRSLSPAGGRLIFSGYDPVAKDEPWVSDGTVAGTRRLLDVHQGAGSSAPEQITPLGDGVLFAVADDVPGEGLWRSDGTPAGTFPLGLGPNLTEEIFATGGDFLYSGRGYDYALWLTDGTAAGI